MHRAVLSIGLLLAGAGAIAGEMDVQPQPMTEWKSVYGEVQTRDVVPARTRIGGTLVSLDVTEGDRVEAGQQVAVVEDDKLALQIDAMEAQLESLKAQLATAQSDLERGEALGERGVITSQRLDELRTAVEVLQGQISATEAQQNVISRQVEEGAVLAPEAGIVLSVPVSRGSVVTAGETVAVVGGGGVFLRLQIPERHADALAEGDVIEIETARRPREGRLAKIYPQIEGGRVAADVEVDGLDRRFVGRRVPVRLPVGERPAILVPEAALHREGGLDFVTVASEAGPVTRSVVPGNAVTHDGVVFREILSGLVAGDVVVTEDD